MSTSRYAQINFITAVPAGTTQAGDINLAAGYYHLAVIGTHAAAGTDPTLSILAYVDEAKSDSVAMKGQMISDTTGDIPLDLEVAETAIYATFGSGLLSSGAMFIPHGLEFLYTKETATAVDLTLVAIPADPASL